MKEKYLTITGFRNYHGSRPFAIGNLIRCCKEPSNPYDGEAIQCSLPVLCTVGYVANSVSTVVLGTMSAGRLYDQVPERFYVRVMFITDRNIICRVEEGDPKALWAELVQQLTAGEELGNYGDWELDLVWHVR